jgi:hypothetical protein
MYTDIALKLKALTLAVMINGLIMGGAAFLFDGQIHQHSSGSTLARTLSHDSTRAQISVFRP